MYNINFYKEMILKKYLNDIKEIVYE